RAIRDAFIEPRVQHPLPRDAPEDEVRECDEDDDSELDARSIGDMGPMSTPGPTDWRGEVRAQPALRNLYGRPPRHRPCGHVPSNTKQMEKNRDAESHDD